MSRKGQQNNADLIKTAKTIYHFFKDTRQKLMKSPTDPKEIHRRAEIIRSRLELERLRGIQQDRIRRQMKEDLDLISFDKTIREAQPKLKLFDRFHR